MPKRSSRPCGRAQIPGVPVKRIEQQALVALHRVREQWMTTRTARINALRGILREHGILLPAGARAAVQAVPTVLEDAAAPLPAHLRHVLASVQEEVRAIEARDRRARARAAGAGRRRSGRRAPAYDPRDWAVDGDRAGRHRGAHPHVSARAPVCELARTDAAGAFQRARAGALAASANRGTCICAASSRMGLAPCSSRRTGAAATPGR